MMSEVLQHRPDFLFKAVAICPEDLLAVLGRSVPPRVAALRQDVIRRLAVEASAIDHRMPAGGASWRHRHARWHRRMAGHLSLSAWTNTTRPRNWDFISGNQPTV